MAHFNGYKEHRKLPFKTSLQESPVSCQITFICKTQLEAKRRHQLNGSHIKGSSLGRRANSKPATPNLSAPHATNPSKEKEFAPPFPECAPVNVSLIDRPS
jgi:hypothetical protein